MARLPQVGGDNDRWGDVLNDFLSVEHNADGSLKLRDEGIPATITDGSITASKLSATVNSYLANAQTAVQTVNGKSGQAITLSASDVSAVSTSAVGAASGIATLDSASKLTAAQLPSSVASISGADARRVSSIAPALLDATPAESTTALHAQIAALTEGRNVITGPAGEITVARQNTVAGLSGSPTSQVLFVLPSGSSLVGQPGLTIGLDPDDDSPAPLLLFQLVATLADGTAGSDILVRDLILNGRDEARTPAETRYDVWGVGNRRDAAGAKVDNVTVQNCTLIDLAVGVTNARRNQSGSLGANRDENWRVLNCDFRICPNRAVELSQLYGATLDDLTFDDCDSAIHLLLWTEQVTGRRIRAKNMRTDGLRINAGTSFARFYDFDLRFADDAESNNGAIAFRSEPTPLEYEVHDIYFTDGYAGSPPSTPNADTPRALSFQADEDSTAITWRKLRFTRVEFDGDVDLTLFYDDPAHELSDFVFTDCEIHGDLVTEAVA